MNIYSCPIIVASAIFFSARKTILLGSLRRFPRCVISRAIATIEPPSCLPESQSLARRSIASSASFSLFTSCQLFPRLIASSSLSVRRTSGAPSGRYAVKVVPLFKSNRPSGSIARCRRRCRAPHRRAPGARPHFTAGRAFRRRSRFEIRHSTVELWSVFHFWPLSGSESDLRGVRLACPLKSSVRRLFRVPDERAVRAERQRSRALLRHGEEAHLARNCNRETRKSGHFGVSGSRNCVIRILSTPPQPPRRNDRTDGRAVIIDRCVYMYFKLSRSLAWLDRGVGATLRKQRCIRDLFLFWFSPSVKYFAGIY